MESCSRLAPLLHRPHFRCAQRLGGLGPQPLQPPQSEPPSALLAGASALLAIAMPGITWLARRLGFSREDEIPIVFCGSKKSLASGVPIAKVLFTGGSLGAIVLPIMVYHQLQLIVCAMVARRYARKVSERRQSIRPR